MGIMEIIERRKQQFFVARDSEKLSLQKEALMKERERLFEEKKKVEEIRALQAEVSKERKDINSMRTQEVKTGFQKFGSGLRTGLQNLNENVKQFSNDSPMTANTKNKSRASILAENVKSFDSSNSDAFRNSLNFNNSNNPFNPARTEKKERTIKKVVYYNK